MRVAGIQHDIVWEDPRANHAALVVPIARAAADGAELIALSEMYSYGFSMHAATIAEPADGPSTAFLVDQAAATGAWLAGSLPLLDTTGSGGRPTNSLVVAGPDGSVHRYAKIHPFTFAGEHQHYAAGTASEVIRMDGIRVTPAICYDLRFADLFWAAAPETDLYLVVANWPASRRYHWRTLLRARAIENQGYVLGVNRIGKGDGLDYAGDSVLLDPLGEVVAEAPEGAAAIVAGTVDPAVVADTRTRFPFLQDRAIRGRRR